MKTRIAMSFALVTLTLAAVACGGGSSGGGGGGQAPAPVQPTPQPPKVEVPEDIIALHDADLSATVPSCQNAGCHPDQMARYAPFETKWGAKVTTYHYLKAKILGEPAHGYFEGRNPEDLEDKDCTVCHKRVKLQAHSGGDAAGATTHLRRMVDTSFCAGCHGRAGPGKPLYLK